MADKRPRWTFEEDRLLEDLYPTVSAAELSLIFGRTPNAIRYHARTLGLSAIRRNKLRKHGIAQYERALELYTRMTAREVAERMGITHTQVKSMVKNAPSVLAVTKNNNVTNPAAL